MHSPVPNGEQFDIGGKVKAAASTAITPMIARRVKMTQMTVKKKISLLRAPNSGPSNATTQRLLRARPWHSAAGT